MELQTLFKEGNEEEGDTTLEERRIEFIMPTDVAIGLELGFPKIWERNFLMQVQTYFSTFSIR